MPRTCLTRASHVPRTRLTRASRAPCTCLSRASHAPHGAKTPWRTLSHRLHLPRCRRWLAAGACMPRMQPRPRVRRSLCSMTRARRSPVFPGGASLIPSRSGCLAAIACSRRSCTSPWAAPSSHCSRDYCSRRRADDSARGPPRTPPPPSTPPASATSPESPSAGTRCAPMLRGATCRCAGARAACALPAASSPPAPWLLVLSSTNYLFLLRLSRSLAPGSAVA